MISGCASVKAEVARTFPPDPTDIACVRRFAREVAESWDVAGEDLALLVTELATNAIQHAGTEFTVRVSRHSRVIRLEVQDQGDGTPARLKAGTDRPDGRGLLLVESLSYAWGVRHEAVGKTVWVELAI